MRRSSASRDRPQANACSHNASTANAWSCRSRPRLKRTSRLLGSTTQGAPACSRVAAGGPSLPQAGSQQPQPRHLAHRRHPRHDRRSAATFAADRHRLGLILAMMAQQQVQDTVVTTHSPSRVSRASAAAALDAARRLARRQVRSFNSMPSRPNGRRPASPRRWNRVSGHGRPRARGSIRRAPAPSRGQAARARYCRARPKRPPPPLGSGSNGPGTPEERANSAPVTGTTASAAAGGSLLTGDRLHDRRRAPSDAA